ncbi:MAG: hypothetical protein IT221_13095 [Fluviicola sp.]|nr:hypothetical protein [Fluviicola sp.]
MKALVAFLSRTYNSKNTVFFLLSIGLFTSLQAFCQASIEVTLKGKVSDSIRTIPLPHTLISVYNENKLVQTVTTDLEGNYLLNLNVLSGKNKLSIEIKSEFYSTYNQVLDSNLFTNGQFNYEIKLVPIKICNDSFLPTSIYFDENAIVLDKKDEMRLLTELFHMNEQLQFMFAKKSLELVAYCDYNEKPQIAEKRMLYIYNMALEAGFKQEDLRMKVYAKRELFVCDYCDGCHYFFLKGQGTTLSKSVYTELATPEEQDAHLAKRRTVLFNWEDKKGY